MRSRLFLLPFILVCRSVIHADERIPIPTAEQQKEADKLVHDVYGGAIQGAKTPDERSALTAMLLDEASRPNTSVGSRYSILKAAIDVAPDAAVAMRVIDKMAEHFEIDGLTAKAYTIKKLAKSASTPSERTALAQSAVHVIDSYIEQDNFRAALLLMEIALDAAANSRNAQVIRSIRSKKNSVDFLARTFADVQVALAILETDPTDAASNTMVGKYKCFEKNAWADGLPHLALGNDEALKKLALKELTQPTSSDQQIELADGWFDLAGQSNEAAKEKKLQRAGYWYDKSLKSEPALSRLVRAKAEARLVHNVDHLSTQVRSFGLRFAPLREQAVRQYGGNDASESAVEEGLRWLTRYQNRAGSWSFTHTKGDNCSGFPNPGDKNTRMGATGLALLAFLGAGHTHKNGMFPDTVDKALDYLVKNMDKRSGRLYEANGLGHSHMYSHGICARAIARFWARWHN